MTSFIEQYSDFLKLKDKRPISSSEFEPLAILFGVSFVFWWTCYFASKVFIEGSNILPAYKGLDSRKKADFNSRVVANIHAVISSLVAFIGFFYTW